MQLNIVGNIQRRGIDTDTEVSRDTIHVSGYCVSLLVSLFKFTLYSNDLQNVFSIDYQLTSCTKW